MAGIRAAVGLLWPPLVGWLAAELGPWLHPDLVLPGRIPWWPHPGRIPWWPHPGRIPWWPHPGRIPITLRVPVEPRQATAHRSTETCRQRATTRSRPCLRSIAVRRGRRQWRRTAFCDMRRPPRAIAADDPCDRAQRRIDDGWAQRERHSVCSVPDAEDNRAFCDAAYALCMSLPSPLCCFRDHVPHPRGVCQLACFRRSRCPCVCTRSIGAVLR